MTASRQNSVEVLNELGSCRDKEESLFNNNCPHCYSQRVKIHSHYQTKSNGERKMLICEECGSYFSQTYGTTIANLATPLSEIIRVLKARMEEMGLNAAVRTFGYSKNTIKDWEKKLSNLQESLFIYALMNEFIQLVIEGDELYTKVNKNQKSSASEGWTVVMMERASRFIWTLKCGRKERKLFLEAVITVAELFERSTDYIQLFTDGERRYSQLLFDICHEVLKTGKRGRQDVIYQPFAVAQILMLNRLSVCSES